MKTFTMKEFELKEDEIFDLADKEGGVILIDEKGRRFILTPIDEDELAKLPPKEDKTDTLIKAGDKVSYQPKLTAMARIYGQWLQR